MLVVDGLTCRFGTKAAVDNAPCSSAPGGFVGVIGRSGAGKSTLLRMINRLADPSEGRILFEGVDVTALSGKNLPQWRGGSASWCAGQRVEGGAGGDAVVAFACTTLARTRQGAGDVRARAVRYGLARR